MDAWLAMVSLSLGVIGVWTTARRRLVPHQEPALTIALTVAALEAARRGHGPVQPVQLAHAAVFALERPDGPDLSGARERIEARLEALPARPRDRADAEEEPLSAEVMAAIRTAAAVAGRAGCTLTLHDVLDLLRTDADVNALLDAANQPPPSQSGRLGAPYRAARASQPAEILMLDDDVSTMDGVLAILCGCFSKGYAEGLHLMLTTHYEGRAVIGRYSWHEAQALRQRGVEHARAAGMPLAIEVEMPGARDVERTNGLAARVRRLFRAGVL